jgi:hypothetical protein
MIILVLIVLPLVLCNYTLVKHPIETGARCLDGSPAALYYSLGSEKNRNKFIIFFNSGGLCKGVSLADTLDGSSANYPPTRDSKGGGLLS